MLSCKICYSSCITCMSMFLSNSLVNIGSWHWQLHFLFSFLSKRIIFSFAFWKMILDTILWPRQSHCNRFSVNVTYFSVNEIKHLLLFWNGYFALIKFIVNFVTVLLTHFPLYSPSFILKTSDLIIMELPFKCALTFAPFFFFMGKIEWNFGLVSLTWWHR